MKIKRYLGKNTQEALLKVKMDLGNNAIILNTKKVRQKGIKKYFTKPMIEVMAAIDDDASKIKEHELTKIRNDVGGANFSKTISPQKEGNFTELENKVNNIENTLNKIMDAVNQNNKSSNIDKKEDEKQLPQIFQLLYNNLIKNEVEQEIAKKIIMQVEKRSNPRDINDATLVMHSVISSLLGKSEPINFRTDGKPTVLLFVGPTGVGKTTTLAKLAASLMLEENKNIGLITADTYRISAVDQLKTYAEILGIPITVAYSVSEIRNEIEKYSDKDVILIDTAGCSFKDKQKFDELKLLVKTCNADDVFLVLSTTVSSRNCKEIINNYSFIPNYKLIFTKVDETSVYGSILNTKCFSNKNLSYIANGQNVPDDIEIANVDKLSKNLLGNIN